MIVLCAVWLLWWVKFYGAAAPTHLTPLGEYQTMKACTDARTEAYVRRGKEQTRLRAELKRPDLRLDDASDGSFECWPHGVLPNEARTTR
jgi:hypothetical protein